MKKEILLLFFLLIQALTFSQPINFKWHKSFGGSGSEGTMSLKVDKEGNSILCGYFTGSVTFQTIAGNQVLTSAGSEDYFLAKLNPEGAVLWVRRFGNSNQELGGELAIDDNNDIYLTVQFKGTIDFDPGPDTKILSSINYNMAVVKLNPDGIFQWVAHTEGSFPYSRPQILLDSYGDVYVAGNINSASNFNPGGAGGNLSSAGASDIFLWKISAAGEYLFARNYGGINYESLSRMCLSVDTIVLSGSFTDKTIVIPGLPEDTSIGRNDPIIIKVDLSGNYLSHFHFGGAGWVEINDIAADPDGNIIVTGMCGDSSLFDPSGNVPMLRLEDDFEIFTAKYKSDGTFMWVVAMGSQWVDEGYRVKTDADGNIYVLATFNETIDFDTGPGISPLTAYDQGIAFLKYSPDGHLVWNVLIDGTWNESANGLELSENDSLITIAGTYKYTFNYDPTDISKTVNSISGSWDIFILKLSQTVCSNMSVRFNNYQRVSCDLSGYLSAVTTGGTEPYSYHWSGTDTLESTTHETPVEESGIYFVHVRDQQGCQDSLAVFVNGPYPRTEENFASVLLAGSFRKGFDDSNTILAGNLGCVTGSRYIALKLDSLTNYVSALPQPDQIINDTLIWQMGNVNFDSILFDCNLVLNTDTSANIGDLVCLQLFFLDEQMQVDTIKGVDSYWYRVVNSYDPNDKQVIPAGACDKGYIKNDQELTYTIRFQNTGNAEAIHVAIVDSLSKHLEINTLKVIAQSHEMITEILPDQVLRFRFDNIFLADSMSNEPESHGYVVFRIKPKQNTVSGAEINNKVGIYFDFNPPVITNTVINTIIDEIPEIRETRHVILCENSTYTYNGKEYSIPGNYRHVFRSDAGCDSTIDLHIRMLDADSIVQIDNGIFTCLVDNASYRWFSCNAPDVHISGSGNQSFLPPGNGLYAVEVTTGNCSVTSSCYAYALGMPGVALSSEKELTVYPVPAHRGESLFVRTRENIRAGRIFSIDGKLLKSIEPKAGNIVEISLDKLEKGLYIIEVLTNNAVYSSKFSIR